MSVYLRKGRGWKYDFTLDGQRHTSTYFKTKTEAKRAEALRREELANPQLIQVMEEAETPTDMAFLELINRRLDYVRSYHSHRHYQEYVYLARRWVKRWKDLSCSQITRQVVENFILARGRVSAQTANKEIRALRATFNWGKKRQLVVQNPLDGLSFLPTTHKIPYVPTPQEIEKVIAAADPDTQDYLCTIRDTLGRISEINALRWDDVNLERKYLVLYTRKRKGGHLTPRKVPMTDRLFQTLARRAEEMDKSIPWVFWHTYTSSKTGERITGPFNDRKKFMRTLCQKAGVRYFRFHALRHSGASVLESLNVPISSIQRILGHTNRMTTEIYLHSLGQTEREAMAVFERAGADSHPNPHPTSKDGLSPWT